MTQVLFEDLARVTRRAFDDILDLFSSESMIQWLMKKNFKELHMLDTMIKRLRTVKIDLKNKERTLRGTLDEGLEEEVIKLRRMLDRVHRNDDLDQNFKLISKFDTQSLLNVEKTIDTLMDKRIILEYPYQRNDKKEITNRREKGYDRF